METWIEVIEEEMVVVATMYVRQCHWYIELEKVFTEAPAKTASLLCDNNYTGAQSAMQSTNWWRWMAGH